MATTHTVKQGEHLARIAAQYGFNDFRTIWNHARNADLVKLRNSPNVLFPGDRVFIPDKQVKIDKIPTDKTHLYRLTAPALKLRIIVKDFDNQPLPNTDCDLEVEGAVFRIKSNAQGTIEHPIPRSAENGMLRIPDLGLEIPLMIGHLDPLDEESGWIARLVNLGYYGGEENPLELRYAIEEFQCDHDLKVTGELDAATKAKLKELYGC